MKKVYDESDDYKRGYRAGYAASQRKNKPETVREIVREFVPAPPPWGASANGAWNGDMFNDWLNNPILPGDPYEIMHSFLNRIIRKNRLAVLNEIKASLARLESEESGDYHD